MAIDTVVQRAAGLDIAKASLVVCFRTPDAEGGWQITKRKFTTITADLLVLADWLGEHGITRVGMESTADNLAPGVLPAGTPLRLLVTQRPSHARRARSQDRRGMDL